MHFGKFNEAMFTVSEDKTILKVIKNEPKELCKYYMVYADVGSQQGLNEGVHLWTIKLMAKNWKSKYVIKACTRRIGITTDQDIRKDDESWRADDLYESGYGFDIDTDYYKSSAQWKIGGMVPLELNCNRGELTWYLDGQMKRKELEDIDPKKKYFIGLSCCATHNHIYYQIVDTPSDI